MPKAFVQSVGTGTRQDQDITRPLVWHWRRSGAGFTVWVVSEQSRAHAERMAHALELSPAQYRIEMVSDTDNVEAVYRDCLALLRDLGQQGFEPDMIEVDYTSGTKAMTAGLVLAAVAHRCGTLSYISGERHGGVVASDTERVVSIEPRRIWADERLRLAGEYCRALRFDAALTLLDSVKPVWLGDYERRLAAGLRLIGTGYGAWDRFEYGRASGELRKLRESAVPDLDPFRPEQSVLTRLVALTPANGFSADRLADLYNNAGRRLDEGRCDDALARLYRLTEMLAQWILHGQYGIDTADVDLAKAPTPLQAQLAARRSAEGKILIGLDLDYQLLKALDHPVGRHFDEGEWRGIGVLLKKRNVSLLAHGLEPVSKKDLESLRDKLQALVALEVPDFVDRRRALEFPWRRGREVASGAG
ncbi:hypothetical protein DNFV4_00477 [Nitrospira tepida]|uniref:TIGR02710 family CRISPR-associated protein n=1 Tax=Nitrospira tepida TaxID=2973512 RepID=A0AA86T921_9BACT|nr:TIGR02710 family CRISPR-associated CARF protein [Nitrospira tepida]CAI4030053.1 hypothetical protein DNFV4_00477 [Nitrospira tepida]